MLATVIGAVDHGYRVILVTDAICSSSDEGHDSLLKLYRERYSLQIETSNSETILSLWATPGRARSSEGHPARQDQAHH